MAKLLYFGVKLSDNMAERADGSLLCVNAVIARTGWQTYKGSELDAKNLEDVGIQVDPSADYSLYRAADEVFSKRTIGSFEGVPITDGHPDELLNVETINEYQCGHIQNVRKGDEVLDSGELPMLADLIITSSQLITKIKELGLRELSCGYNYNIAKKGDALWQIDIIGNHVAVVPVARAGREASIKDSAENLNWRNFDMSKMTSGFLKAVGLHSLAKTLSPEDFATAFDAATAAKDAEHKEGCDCSACKPMSKDAKATDRERYYRALDKLLDGKEEEQQAQDADVEELKKMFGGKDAADSKEEEEEEEEANDESGEEIEETEATDSEISEEDRPKPGVPAAVDAAYQKGLIDGGKAVIKALKPTVAASNNPKLVKAFDSASKIVSSAKPGSKGSYGAVAKAAATAGKDAATANDSFEARQAKAIAEANASYKSMKRTHATASTHR